MTVKINSIDIPLSMRNRAANYLYMPGIPMGRNGLGEVITAGGGVVTWTWAQLDQTEFTWWMTTILGGLQSKEFTGSSGIIVLYDETHAEKSFSHGIVMAPQYQGYSGVSYHGVTIQIDGLYV